MPNQQIIVTAIISFSVYVATKIFEMVLKKIIDPMIPERKKLISYIGNGLDFIASYILPIGVITYLMVFSPLDKWFVFFIAFNFTMILYNICLLLFGVKRFIPTLTNMKASIDAQGEQVDKLMSDMTDVLNKLR